MGESTKISIANALQEEKRTENFKPHVEQSFKSIGKVFNDLILFRGSAEKNTFQYFLPQTFNDSIPFEGSAEKSTSFSSPSNPNE